MQRTIAVVRQGHDGGRRGGVGRLGDDHAWRAEGHQCRGRFTLEGHLLRSADGVVWNHHGTGMAPRIARLERHVEGTADSWLEARPRARVLRWIEIKVVAIVPQVDRAHHQQPIARARHRHTLRRALPGQVGRIEVDLSALDGGLGQAQPANSIVEAVGDQHRTRIAEHAEPARAVDLRRIGRTDVSEQTRSAPPGHCRDGAGREVDAANPLIEKVGDVKIALVEGRAPGTAELGLGDRRSISVGLVPGPGDGRDQVPGHLANPVIEAVGDV